MGLSVDVDIDRVTGYQRNAIEVDIGVGIVTVANRANNLSLPECDREWHRSGERVIRFIRAGIRWVINRWFGFSPINSE